MTEIGNAILELFMKSIGSKNPLGGKRVVSERNALILSRLYDFRSNSTCDRKDCARELGITRERVRFAHNRAMGQIRKAGIEFGAGHPCGELRELIIFHVSESDGETLFSKTIKFHELHLPEYPEVAVFRLVSWLLYANDRDTRESIGKWKAWKRTALGGGQGPILHKVRSGLPNVRHVDVSEIVRSRLYPNNVQMFKVSLSQHYYLLKGGAIRWQMERFDIGWGDRGHKGKKHLATFIIIDLYSGCFYAEMHPMDRLPTVEVFLFRAWSRKKDYLFEGIGTNVLVDQGTLDLFPSLENFFRCPNSPKLLIPKNGIEPVAYPFQEWERNVMLAIPQFLDADGIAGFQTHIQAINRFINTGLGNGEDNLGAWIAGKPKILLPEDMDDFARCFDIS